MTRKHSTRLSQAHEEEDDQGQRTASADYPELGTVLTDRPDPGKVITVIGMRRQADAYGTEQDDRNGEYNGGEGDLGMYWAEPGQQKWTEEHLGPQQEAPPPLYDPEMMPPAMARLAAIEEAQEFFGLRHHATTINGTQVDDAGDAPGHGTVVRSKSPNKYDDDSQEGTGDPKWDDPVPWGDEENENAATVGMYPEGISAGGGPGISVGPTVAHIDEEWSSYRPDLTHVHGQMITGPQLAAHLRQHHRMDFDPRGVSVSQMRTAHTLHHMQDFDHTAPDLRWSEDFDDGDHAPPAYEEHEPGNWATPFTPTGDDDYEIPGSATYHAHGGPIDPVFGSREEHPYDWGGLRSHMIAEHGTSDPYARHANPYELDEHHAWLHENQEQDHDHYIGYGPPEHVSPLEDWAWDQGGDASGYHEFTGSRREARVPWTGKERGNLHSWHAADSATWGDFVNSADFPLLDPGESVHHAEPQEGLPPVEGAAEDPYWEAHLRDLHGLSDDQIRRARSQGDPLEETHDVLHRAGGADHAHPGGPEDALSADPKAGFLADTFGRDIGITPKMRALMRDRSGGSSRPKPSESWAMPAPFTSPDAYRQDDPARFRRMMSALNVHVRVDGQEVHGHDHDDDGPDEQAPPHEHDDPDDDLDSPPDNASDKNGPEIKSPQFSSGDPQDSAPDARTPPDNWPQAGADVSETGRAYTQGSDGGKVKRGAPPPAPFAPGDADSGGGGDQGDDGDRPDDDSTPFSRDGALAAFAAAAGNAPFRFEFTAAWHDVVAKAKRIRAEGHVRITHASAGMVIGEVRGDHDTYESGIQRPVGRQAAIQHWACGCPWASFKQDKSSGTRYAGRPCSHVMALQFEAQSRGMFGRQLSEDPGVPSWSPPSVVVKSYPPYEGDPHAGQWREQWRAPLARRRATPDERRDQDWPPEERDEWEARHGAPCQRATADLLRAGEDPGAVGALRLLAGLSASPEDYVSGRMMARHLTEAHGTAPDLADYYARDLDDINGFHGLLHQHGAAVRLPHRHDVEPGEPGPLRAVESWMRTADQSNSPWGSQNVTKSPPQKPYGATSEPNKDQDPGSYGFLAAPDPDNWGSIQDDSAMQMPLTNTAAHEVLVPGAPRPVPGDLHWPDVSGWQQEDQGSFGYTDRANTAGPSTAMTPRDPQGIRMEEARCATAAGTPYPVRDTVPQLDGALAELRDHPEGALPETTGEDEIEATAAADGTIGGGDAGTGQGQGAAGDTAALGEFGAARRMYLHHLAGTPMGDLGRETWPQAQQPSPVGQEPGMGSGDEALTPDDQSIQTTGSADTSDNPYISTGYPKIGNQQWSGGGADSDEVTVPAGQPQGGIDDIIASFQRSAASLNYSSGGRPAGDGDIAGAARQYLEKTADVLPRAEADELVREGAGSRARNLDLLRLEGTHYEDEDEELGKKGVSLDDYDDDVIFA